MQSGRRGADDLETPALADGAQLGRPRRWVRVVIVVLAVVLALARGAAVLFGGKHGGTRGSETTSTFTLEESGHAQPGRKPGR